MRTIAAFLMLVPLLAQGELEEYLSLCHRTLENAGEGELYDPEYCNRAAEMGSAEAHYVMGGYYSMVLDWEKAKQHYQASIDGGFIWGHIGMGHSLITSDPEAAEKHYRIVAKSGDEAAIVALSFIGDLRVHDEEFLEAYSWFYACFHFDTYAREFCKIKMQRLVKYLDEEQIQHAVEGAQAIIDWFSDNNALNTDAGEAGAG